MRTFQGLTRQKTRKFIAAGLVGSIPVRLAAGVPSEYLNDRLPRAREWAAKTKKSAYTVLLEWWGQDKGTQRHRTGNLHMSSDSSFDADEVFATMLAKTYGCDKDNIGPADTGQGAAQR